MVLNTRENGPIIRDMDRENISLVIQINTLVIGLRIKNLEKENTIIQMEIIIKVIGLMTILKAMEN
jgi:hypothetical protein